MPFPKRPFSALLFLLLLSLPAFAATTVMVNSQDYQDILSAAVFSKAYGYNFVFALTPNQSVFISRYYTLNKNDSVIYLEGARPVLPNMAALLRESGVANATIVQPPSVPQWVADQMPHEQAIVVGSQYGQDALSVAPYAALTRSPVYFIDDPSHPEAVMSALAAKGYASVIFYGPVAHELPPAELALAPQRRAIDTGSRYSNNIAIAREFLARKPTGQVMFVSGRTFEKSMVDTQFPVILVGRSDAGRDVAAFLRDANITSGIVFSGDADIVDGVTKLRSEAPNVALFVKFGEGYLGATEPLPLMVIPLPSPTISLEVLNVTYNIAAKRFEVRVANKGDFVALTAGVSVAGVGAADSSQILMDPATTTTVPVSLDASLALAGGQLPAADVTMRYGEDSGLMDNVDTIRFADVPTTSYVDNSSVTLASVAYSPDEKAFLLSFDGQGFAEGTIQFSINNRPVTVYFPASQIAGPTTVTVKHLLTSDEEKFINGLPAAYFMRSGARSDLLLRESRGTAPVSVPRPLVLGGGLLPAGAGGLSLAALCALPVFLGLLAAVYYFFMRRGGEGSFD